MFDKPISRKDFLKLLGAGGIVLGVGWLGGIGPLYEQFKKGQTSRPGGSSAPFGSQLAYAQSTGTWVPGQNTMTVALGCALTPNGKIFYFAGSGWNNANSPNGPFTARYLDLSTGSDVEVPIPGSPPQNDLFCVGMNQLQNGNILLTGGTLLYDTDINSCNGKWHGAKDALEFNYSTGQLEQLPPMRAGRWYPSQMLLPNGRVVVVAGDDEYGNYNYLVEIYDPATRSWSTQFDPSTNNTYCVGAGAACAGAGSPCFGGPNQGTAPWLSLYPRMIYMPSGLVYTSSQREVRYMYDPSTGIWTNNGNTALGQYRDYGTSILLPLQNTTAERGKVMVVGGALNGTAPATRVVEIHDFNQGTNTNPVIRTVGQLSVGRRYVLPIILPNGKIMLFGGSSGGNTPIYAPDSFDPENEAQGWTALAPATVPRLYHGTALLMTNGSVWTAGSTPGSGGNWELRTEFFRPNYFSATRPTISGNPTVGGYGGSITIPTPNPTGISRVSLVKLGCTTHHYDIDMRLIWLQITSRGTNSVTVSAPISANIAPAGYYMIHVLDNALVPSVANIIKIPGTAQTGDNPPGPPAQVAGLAVTTPSGTTTQLDLTWTANTEADFNHYNVYRGTTAGFPVTLGTTTPIATPTTSSYSNTGLTAGTTYYYKVAAVDNSNNIGNLSTEVSGTTGGASPSAPTQVTGLTVIPAGATQLNLAWTANPTAENIANYNVYRGTTAGFTVVPGTTVPLAQPPINSYSNTGLTASTTYYYRVAAVNTTGQIGPLSTEVLGTTASGGPDTTVPVVAITSPANNATVPPGNVPISGTSADNVGGSGVIRVEVRVDNGAYVIATPQAPGNWSTWTVTLNITALGSHTLRARVTDAAGNVSWNPGTLTVNVVSGGDTPPAQVTGLVVTTPAGTTTQLNLTWTANTEADLNHYNVYRGTFAGFDAGATTPVATPTTNSYSNTGLTASTTYYYRVAAVDNTNNIGTLSAEMFGRTGSAGGADTTIPVVAITSPANNATVPVGNVVISGTSADNTGGSGVRLVELRVDDNGVYVAATPQAPGNWSTWTITRNITVVGSHTLRARVTDNAGNVSWNPGTYSINVGTPIDTTIPVVAITSPANNATVPVGNVVISGTSADNTGGSGVRLVELRVDDNGVYVAATPQAPGNWSTWTITRNITVVGSHTLRARVTDNAGNVSWNPGTRTINVV